MAASRTLKNMNTDSTKHDLTYTTELHSQMHHKNLDTRYVEGHFLIAKPWPQTGTNLLDDTFKTSAIRNNKTVISAIAKPYFGIL